MLVSIESLHKANAVRWHLWRWVMARASEGGSRRVPVSLACDGAMCACTCLTEDVECLPCM